LQRRRQWPQGSPSGPRAGLAVALFAARRRLFALGDGRLAPSGGRICWPRSATTLLGRVVCGSPGCLRPPPTPVGPARIFSMSRGWPQGRVGRRLSLATFSQREPRRARPRYARASVPGPGWPRCLCCGQRGGQGEDSRWPACQAFGGKWTRWPARCSGRWRSACVLWELRRGSRWPLLAPLLFVAALGGSLLASTAASASPSHVTHLLGGAVAHRDA